MDAFHRVVANMMARFGRGNTATVIVQSEGGYNVATSEYEAPADVEYVVKAIVLDYNLQSNGTQTEKGSLIQAGDKQVFIQPLDGMPKLKPNKDSILIGTTRYRIITCKEVNPSQADLVLIELYVRE